MEIFLKHMHLIMHVWLVFFKLCVFKKLLAFIRDRWQEQEKSERMWTVDILVHVWHLIHLSTSVWLASTWFALKLIQVCTSLCVFPKLEIMQMKLFMSKNLFSPCSPEGFEHKITVQASPSVDKRKTQGSESTTPPASPGVIPRLRAIRCECNHLKYS